MPGEALTMAGLAAAACVDLPVFSNVHPEGVYHFYLQFYKSFITRDHNIYHFVSVTDEQQCLSNALSFHNYEFHHYHL